MFSAYQPSIYQHSAYQIVEIPAANAGGHFGGYREYEAYRRKLQRLLAAYEAHDKTKYVKNIVEVVEISEELPVATPEITQAATALQQGLLPQIDYEDFAADILRLLSYLEKQLEAYQFKIEEEEEMMLFALI